MQATENYLDTGEIGGLYKKAALLKNLQTNSPPSENAPPTSPAAMSSPRYNHCSSSFEQIFGRVVENVKPSPMTFGALDDDSRGYDLYGFGSGTSNSSNNSSLSSSSAMSILDDSSSSNTTLHASDDGNTSIDDGLQLTPTRPGRIWSKNNCIKKTLNGNCCEECDLCFLTCSWPSSSTSSSNSSSTSSSASSTPVPSQQKQSYYVGGLRFIEFRPIISCCKCTPCQCTFENNYCGCHSLGAGPCC